MISRRHIIRGRQEEECQSGKQASRRNSSRPHKLPQAGMMINQQQQQQQQQQDSSDSYADNSNPYEDYHQLPVPKGSPGSVQEMKSGYWQRSQLLQHHSHQQHQHQQQQQQQLKQQQANKESDQNYRHFDPYSIYSDEDDVWYFEERLFEDHLEEIFNKWRLLDDDIWCKLIIMERNRRIGKAYARVPIVTIDGSHELSYDGYKLALNGFDNPDRDAAIEECRKRIGKGIRIKMDNFGNILIKRLSKANVFIKQWLQPGSSSGGSSSAATGSSAGGAGAGSGREQRAMPSRQQLIKNQLAAEAAARAAAGTGTGTGTALPGGSINSSATPTTSSSGASGSSLADSGGPATLPSNDSALCDELLAVGGQLDPDKIYVMFDMKKFQANITQELCRAYPDKRKLEQQCFSIVSLVSDAEEILNLPCWVMIINIVAIEMLNERFPNLANSGARNHFPDTMLLVDSQPTSSRGATANQRRISGSNVGPAAKLPQAPSFVSIFDHHQHHHTGGGGAHIKTGSTNGHQLRRGQSEPMNNNNNNSNSNSNKEEDPYSLPANASSSDVKSSMNASDYGVAKCPSRYLAAGDRLTNRLHESANQARHGSEPMAGSCSNLRYKSKSNCNIFATRAQQSAASGAQPARGGPQRNTGGGSIYSPGHMLLPPQGDHSVPPKLPPRDFNVNRKTGHSKSSLSVCEQENIYSVGMQQARDVHPTEDLNAGLSLANKLARKSKKNRLMESLKAPLGELTKSSSSSSSAASRSASVLAAPISGDAQGGGLAPADKKASSKAPKGFTKTGTKNLKSLLGVSLSKSSKTTTTTTTTADSTTGGKEITVSDSNCSIAAAAKTAQKHQLKELSALDNLAAGSSEDLRGGARHLRRLEGPAGRRKFGPASHSYNDLDIPTPDYETDENIYAIEEGSVVRRSYQQMGKNLMGAKEKQLAAAAASGAGGNKQQSEDLYYSGYRAHGSQLINHSGHITNPRTIGPKSIHDGPHVKLSSMGGARESSRYMMHNSRLLRSATSKMGSRDLIYGSSMGLHAPMNGNALGGGGGGGGGGSRCRSASMQRYYPRSHQVAASPRSHSELYDLEVENPYAMSGDLGDLAEDRYGANGGIGRMGRNRSSSKLGLNRLKSSGSGAQLAGAPLSRLTPSVATSNYDIGRSSSGIYGNNSSSSSSDYSGWHPQMRKVNSSGYLNSIFKNHLMSPVVLPSNGVGGGSQLLRDGSDHNLTNNYNSNINSNRNLRDYSDPRSLNAEEQCLPSKQQKQKQHLDSYNKQTPNHPLAGTMLPADLTYRSYDSSNDSEPSYTNSSDGLDIYDHIEAHSRPINHQFLDMAPIGGKPAPEVHVGEWENIYEQ